MNPPESTPLAHRIAERCFRIVDGQLWIGDVAAERIATQFGTPLFVYDQGVMEFQRRRLRESLPAGYEIYYSMKANPLQAVLRLFGQLGCGIEVASAGELNQALHAGCPPERVLFAGPGKAPEELRAALAAGVGEIHAESLLELDRISAISRELDVCAHVALRINPTDEVQGGAMRMGGKPSPFGIDEETLPQAVHHVESLPGVKLQGVHLFTGTQILDADVLAEQHGKCIDIAAKVAQQIGRPLKTIDFGGGLGVPYYPHENQLDLGQVARHTARIADRVKRHPLLAGARLIVEPGRFLVAEAGVYLARIIDIKRSRGRTFLVLDGGMHHHLAASGNLGQTIKRNYPVAIVNKLDVPATQKYDVVGPLCTPLDMLARQVSLPPIQVGDLFGVFQSGAYGRTSSPLTFLSHRAPPEVMVTNGAAQLIRRRGEPADFLRDQPRDDGIQQNDNAKERRRTQEFLTPNWTTDDSRCIEPEPLRWNS